MLALTNSFCICLTGESRRTLKVTESVRPCGSGTFPLTFNLVQNQPEVVMMMNVVVMMVMMMMVVMMVMMMMVVMMMVVMMVMMMMVVMMMVG